MPPPPPPHCPPALQKSLPWIGLRFFTEKVQTFLKLLKYKLLWSFFEVSFLLGTNFFEEKQKKIMCSKNNNHSVHLAWPAKCDVWLGKRTEPVLAVPKLSCGAAALAAIAIWASWGPIDDERRRNFLSGHLFVVCLDVFLPFSKW